MPADGRRQQNDALDFGPDSSAVQELTDLSVEEVSLVNRPANQRKFLVVKNVMEKLGALLESASKSGSAASKGWPSDMAADEAIEGAIDELGDLLHAEDSFGADAGSQPSGWPRFMSVEKYGRGRVNRALQPLQLAVASALSSGGREERRSLIAGLERALEILRMGESRGEDDEEAA